MACFWLVLVNVRVCGIAVSVYVGCNGRKRQATGSSNSYGVRTMHLVTNKAIANRADNSEDITILIAFGEGSVLKCYLHINALHTGLDMLIATYG